VRGFDPVGLHDLGQEAPAHLGIGLPGGLPLQILPHRAAERLEALEIAHLARQGVVQRRKLLPLHLVQRYPELPGLPPAGFVGMILREANLGVGALAGSERHDALFQLGDGLILTQHQFVRLRRPGDTLVEVTPSHLRLAAEVTVDYREAVDYARALLEEAGGGEALDRNPGCLLRELLPGWWEDWVLVERERFRQLRLHGLEAHCRRLTRAGRFAQAVEAGLAAVAMEPLRESAHRLLISAHLAEGNRAEALRQYRAYQRLLREELALDPSPQIQTLLGELRIR